MFTYRIRLHGGALHGQEFETRGESRVPRPGLVRDGRRYRVVHQETPDRWVAVPDEVMPGPCRWCAPAEPGPSSCSCPQPCDSWRCGRIFPRRDHLTGPDQLTGPDRRTEPDRRTGPAGGRTCAPATGIS